MYRLFVPQQAVGANLIYFDLFNATGSGADVEVLYVQPVASGSVAVTGVLGINLFLQRTSAVGTGGTAATRNGTDPTACTISAVDNSQTVNALITARLTPSGGATAGAVIAWTCVFGEETSAGVYAPQPCMLRPNPDMPRMIIKQGTGMSIVQGSVAATGQVGFNVAFAVRAL